MDDLEIWAFASISPNDLKTLATAFDLDYFTDGEQISHTRITVLIPRRTCRSRMERNLPEMGRRIPSREGRSTNVNFSRRVLVAALIGLVLAAACIALVVYSGGDLRPPARLTDEQEFGRSLYSANCAACHEVNQLALKKVPPNLHGIFAHDRLPSGSPATDDEVRLVISRGKNTMPPFDHRLTSDQVAAIISYLHTGSK